AAVAGLAGLAALGHLGIPAVAAKARAHAAGEARPDAARAWAALERCFLGEHVDGAAGQGVVDERLRLVEVGVRSPGSGVRFGNGADEWPGRCAPHARVLHEGAMRMEAGALDYYVVRLLARTSPGAPAALALASFGDVWRSAATDYELPAVA